MFPEPMPTRAAPCPTSHSAAAAVRNGASSASNTSGGGHVPPEAGHLQLTSVRELYPRCHLDVTPLLVHCLTLLHGEDADVLLSRHPDDVCAIVAVDRRRILGIEQSALDGGSTSMEAAWATADGVRALAAATTATR